MKRLFAFLFFTALGAAMIFCALQVPAHWRAVDEIVLRAAGAGTPSVTEKGLEFVKNEQLGAARLFAAAAESAGIADADKLNRAIADLAARNAKLDFVGVPVVANLADLFKSNLDSSGAATQQTNSRSESVTEFIVRSENRTRALELLQHSSSSLVQSLLKFRLVTNTVLFPASSSTSGQALDTAVCLCGLLAEAGDLSAGLSNAIASSLAIANSGGNPQPAEQLLMDVMSLGQRFNWGQLALFVGQITDAETLRRLSNILQKDYNRPVVYTAVCLSGNAAGVASQLTKFTETGMNDLRTGLASGAGGISHLLQRNQRLCDSTFCQRAKGWMPSRKIAPFAAVLAYKAPWLALTVKWSLYFLGGLFLALALHCVRSLPARERPLEVRGFHVVRELLFAFGFLLIVLLLSEPFLTQESQKGTPPFRFHLPTVGGVIAAEKAGAHAPIMNHLSLLTLLLFFVLQALIYIACLVKLSEIRRQSVPARLKLKLLENEEHLFDAGLYLGFAGTIISLILVSLGVIKPSLMAAYSSTSFGILFVSFFKIFHLRSVRRRLLLEVEDEPVVRHAPYVQTPATMPS